MEVSVAVDMRQMGEFPFSNAKLFYELFHKWKCEVEFKASRSMRNISFSLTPPSRSIMREAKAKADYKAYEKKKNK
jgi:hypothetical protein